MDDGVLLQLQLQLQSSSPAGRAAGRWNPISFHALGGAAVACAAGPCSWPAKEGRGAPTPDRANWERAGEEEDDADRTPRLTAQQPRMGMGKQKKLMKYFFLSSSFVCQAAGWGGARAQLSGSSYLLPFFLILLLECCSRSTKLNYLFLQIIMINRKKE